MPSSTKPRFSDSGANAPDAIPLDELAGTEPRSGQKKGLLLRRLVNFKILISIFVIFVFVVSDVFTNNVLTGFRGAVHGRTATPKGTVVQGIFLVIFYVIFLKLLECDIV